MTGAAGIDEAEIREELRGLRSRVPELTGAMLASADGLVLAHETPPGTEPEGLAALTAAALGVGARLSDAAARGDFRELLVRGSGGYVATYAAGGTAVLTLLAGDRVNVGRLHLEGRRAGRRLAAMMPAAPVVEARPGGGPAATTVPAGRGPAGGDEQPAALPVRSPGTARPGRRPGGGPRSSGPRSTA
ncbi:roadblock/LC7 domain-containing protein [Streptomyces abyssomicinicus]|uniref:roadblock/LC7 domain-containing protein n=1 Tax=Streptomyces abyssomicinicus TaxID=574929 RepID=UPI00124FA7DB|nr:roadblock/LC7 domain-containing protein [Streptomyces abyssomicinicus]